MNNERLLTIVTDDGKEVLCEILFTHHSDETNKDYVVFVQKGTNEASAAVYVPTADGNGELKQIETEKEWTMLEELLADYADKMEEHDHDGCGCGCDHCDSECDCEGEEDCDCEDEGCSCGHHHE